jgi:RNA polymerase sigma-70 factor, ECF subfamily
MKMRAEICMNISRQQFDQLALDQLDGLHRIARRITGDLMCAEDLVQDTFVRAISGYESFRMREYGIMPWLIRIMRNSNLSHADRERRRPVTMIGAPAELPALNHHIHSPVETDTLQSLDERLVHALDDLPEVNRTVMLMWVVQDLSYQEIADALAVPLGTVMSRLHRARRRMKLFLKEYSSRAALK